MRRQELFFIGVSMLLILGPGFILFWESILSAIFPPKLGSVERGPEWASSHEYFIRMRQRHHENENLGDGIVGTTMYDVRQHGVEKYFRQEKSR